MITLISQATQERASLPEASRKPTFIYIDEARDYFDDSLEGLLNTARKYNVGVTLATQNLGQFDRKLLATVLASTSIKFAGGVSTQDAKVLADEMNCKPEFISAMQKTPQETNFALSVRNVHFPRRFSFAFRLGYLRLDPRWGGEEMAKLIQANQQRYCAPYDPNHPSASTAAANADPVFGFEEPQVL